MNDILTKIIEKRKTDILQKGKSFGFDVPEKRTRKITPFLQKKGAILEVKRASPSKGDIAPNLDPFLLAKTYAQSGAAAISCLTEENFFKGSLGDLMKVCQSVDSFSTQTGKNPPAVLRKDFLLDEDEIDVSFRAGADAVLLIARILDENLIVRMAKKCASLGISALFEIRSDDDVKKLRACLAEVDEKFIVAGVNSRDLKTFSLDPLVPAKMFEKIKNAGANRIVFESGIKTTESAKMAASFGFNGILLGEAVAKNEKMATDFVESFTKTLPNANGESWRDFAKIEKKSPLVKICGITRIEDAIFCAELGADFLGFVFYKKSPRFCEPQTAKKIVAELKERFGEKCPKLVAVVADLDSVEARAAAEAAKQKIFWKVQLHAIPFENAKDFLNVPHFFAQNVSDFDDLEKTKNFLSNGEPRILVDSKSGNLIGGSGKRIDENLVGEVAKFTKLWIAGGINPQNIRSILQNFSPELIDVSSGVESSPGIKDSSKLRELFKMIHDSF